MGSEALVDTGRLEFWSHTMCHVAAQVVNAKDEFIVELRRLGKNQLAQEFVDMLDSNQAHDPYEIMRWMDDTIQAVKTRKSLQDAWT